jgi:hypothetical protein
VPGEVAVIPLVIVVAAALAWSVLREDARLRGRARRYRQLELEGIEELRRGDPYPEEPAVQGGGYLGEPDGRRADSDRVLREELERAREHTIRRRKGGACLL